MGFDRRCGKAPDVHGFCQNPTELNLMRATSSTDVIQIDRRRLIQATALMAGGFMLGLSSPVRAAKLVGAAFTNASAGEVPLNAWVRIQSDNMAGP
ncbi:MULTISPECIES: hypothetical protein [unclassified Rhizobium]|uniref:hypothetical protein n=1 Tax=unclassified Rhizobium TaxID=2613769 RepID=UPI000EA990E0|nr:MULTISPECIES: hypothetical protein [unclassified Rhizobium]AYG70179.1 hypothetical protein CCGE531_29535 [Rhizobium sp. CCGE531]AYG76554.1 hypothetical protein CCGE532_29010 [Rhizobium sp. CCGE532]